MNESTTIEIQFKITAAGDAILTDELALLESILPEIIREIMQAEVIEEGE